MALLARPSPLSPPPAPVVRSLVPIVAVMLGSLTAALPVIATAPVVPPFGFLVFIAWRLLRPDPWPIWTALPLGLFDDLLSGQPIGSAMALWTAALLALEVVDTRLLFRDARSDFALAAGLVTLDLLLAELLARIIGPIPSPLYLGPQWLGSILAFPIVLRACAWLDRRRFGR